jgi:hypothetical protein
MKSALILVAFKALNQNLLFKMFHNRKLVKCMAVVKSRYLMVERDGFEPALFIGFIMW